METLAESLILAELPFYWWQGVLLVVLITLIIVYFQLRKRQM